MSVQNAKSHCFVRNPGIPLNLDWVESTVVNRSATERRCASLPGRRTVKKQWQAAWLVRAITCMDLTSLNGDDTPETIRRLCAKAKQPVRPNIQTELGFDKLSVGAVCVYHEFVETAVRELEGTGIPVAAVAAGFPHGLSPFRERVHEIIASVGSGAKEIDIVISRQHVLNGNWRALYDEVQQFREACGDAHLKTIIATGDLATQTNIARASLVCMMAGSDFIKTSTGKEPTNANLPVGLTMIRQARDFHQTTGFKVGFKPAGGIRTAKNAVEWLILIREELGNDWLNADLFRIGASTLLNDIERQLDHFVTGRYAASYKQPMG